MSKDEKEKRIKDLVFLKKQFIFIYLFILNFVSLDLLIKTNFIPLLNIFQKVWRRGSSFIECTTQSN